MLPAKLCDARLVAVERVLGIVWRRHAFALACDRHCGFLRRYGVPGKHDGERGVRWCVLCSKLCVDSVVGMVSVLGHVRQRKPLALSHGLDGGVVRRHV